MLKLWVVKLLKLKIEKSWFDYQDTRCCALAIQYVLPKLLPGPNLQIRFMKNSVHMSLLGSLIVGNCCCCCLWTAATQIDPIVTCVWIMEKKMPLVYPPWHEEFHHHYKIDTIQDLLCKLVKKSLMHLVKIRGAFWPLYWNRSGYSFGYFWLKWINITN